MEVRLLVSAPARGLVLFLVVGVATPSRRDYPRSCWSIFLHRADNCATVSPSTAQQLNKEVKVGVVAVAKYQHGYSLLVTPW